MVRISIDYQGELHCQATHGPSGRMLETDAPVDNHGRGESFSPTDLVATAMGTCMATVMNIFARRHELELAGMHIEVTKEMSTDAPRRIVRLAATIDMPIPESHPLREALERAALTCPVHQSLHPDVQKPVAFRYRKPSTAPA